MKTAAVYEDVVGRDILPLMSEGVEKALRYHFARHPGREREVTEIRVRAGLPICLVTASGDFLLSEAPAPTGEDIKKILTLIADCSYYALESEFSNGYITLPGGHRAGLAGQAAYWNESTVRLRDISGICIRVARDILGAADKVIPKLIGQGQRLRSTLVISPPGCGKTTLLRDLCRHASRGNSRIGLKPCQVGIVDERSEIAASLDGVPQHDLGPRVDVLDRWPKAKGMMMLLRSMGPDVIATDEIGSDEDAKAVATALLGGASVLATCHGESVEAVLKRPHSSWLISRGFFDMAVVLSRRLGPGTIEYAGEVANALLRKEETT